MAETGTEPIDDTKHAGRQPRSRTAVVFIHGMGEQRPLETLRDFVESVYQRDHRLAADPSKPGPLKVSIVPDSAAGSAELRRITTLEDGPRTRTDFFELYWADIMDGTPVEMVTSWIRMLLLRSPWRLPSALKVRRAWRILLVLAAIVVAAGWVAVYPAPMEGWFWTMALGMVLGFLRPYAGTLLMFIGVVTFLWQWAAARGDLKQIKLTAPLLLLVAGLLLYFLPAPMADSLRFWAGAITAGVAWGMNALIAPYLGDVVRYVRATPQTVGKRREVRERGLALLEALHAKRLSGDDKPDFTQATAKELPLYDRIVIVGHSLGSVIAYDLLQLFWEKHGPTHHQDWSAGNEDVEAALLACDVFVQKAWAKPPVPIDLDDFTRAQERLFELLRDAKPRWRISDLITLGSPLAHAEFLMTDSLEDVRKAFEERRFGTCPPHPEPNSSGSMLFRGRGPRGALFPHFAAQFSAVRWTNICDDETNPLFGDLFSGPLRGTFGTGITEHDLKLLHAGKAAPLGRVFTHTAYWDWEKDKPMPDAVAELCAALRLGP